MKDAYFIYVYVYKNCNANTLIGDKIDDCMGQS